MRFGKLSDSVGIDFYNFAGTKLHFVGVAKLLVCERFKGNGISVLAFTDENRDASKLITSGNDCTLARENENGHCAVDKRLRVFDSVGEGILLVNECRNKLGGVNPTARHSVKVTARLSEASVDKLLGVVNHTNCANCVCAEL